MTDHSDLIERLRWRERVLEDGSRTEATIERTRESLREAASALSSQSLSLSEARAERDELKKELLAAQGQADEHYHRLLDAQREIERLKKERDDAVSDLCRWRAAFQRFTPGGSEFMNPQAVREWADGLKMQVFEANKRAVLAERKALENGPAGLADAHTNPPLSDLSSLRKGAEDEVKQIDWRDMTYKGVEEWIGHCALSQSFTIKDEGEDRLPYRFTVRPFLSGVTSFPTADEAKSAAQSDFETRIRSALVSGSREDGDG